MRTRGMYVWGACASLALLTWYTTRSLIRKRTSYTLIFDDVFSKHAQELIYTWIEKNQDSDHTFNVWCSELKNSMKGIGEITIEQQDPYTRHMMIKSAKPIALINDYYVCNENGFLVPQQLITPHAIRFLPRIYRELKGIDTPPMPHEFLNFIQRIPSSCTQKYAILSVDETTTYLRDEKDPWLLFNISLEHMPHILASLQAEQLKKIIQEQKKKYSSIPSKWLVVDFRFENQMVMYQINKLPLQQELGMVGNR